jgi:G:T-mismatch repair DNA endonuclease (very short patch repair protein)
VARRKQRRKNTEPEKKVKEILRELGYQYRVQFMINDLGRKRYFDIYIPRLNTLIEVDGIYWHGKGLLDEQLNAVQRKNRKNDKFKERIAAKHGFKLVRIWEDEISINKVKKLLCDQ